MSITVRYWIRKFQKLQSYGTLYKIVVELGFTLYPLPSVTDYLDPYLILFILRLSANETNPQQTLYMPRRLKKAAATVTLEFKSHS